MIGGKLSEGPRGAAGQPGHLVGDRRTVAGRQHRVALTTRPAVHEQAFGGSADQVSSKGPSPAGQPQQWVIHRHRRVPGRRRDRVHAPWAAPARSKVWPTSPGAMACAGACRGLWTRSSVDPALTTRSVDRAASVSDLGTGRVPRSGGNEGVVMLSDDARAGR
jgi:hypothetical protein